MATIALTSGENPLEFGIVITGRTGPIERFLEKPTWGEVFSDTINTGIYVLEPEVLGSSPPAAGRGLPSDVFPQGLLDRGDPLFGHVVEGYWEDVGNPESYRRAHDDILEEKIQIEMPFTRLDGNIWVGEGTIISPSANITGPAVIGHNCQIGPGVTITPGTVIGDNVIVGEGSSLKRPVIWNNVYIGEEAALRGCVIGKNTSVKRGANILEGAIIANECVVGEHASIRPNVKVWPNKVVSSSRRHPDQLADFGHASPTRPLRRHRRGRPRQH